MTKAKQLISLCNLDEMADDSSRGFDHKEAGFFIVKKDGLVYAYKNRCPHLGIPLEMQPHEFLDLENTFIQCATHGAIFNIEDGYCIAGPCQGESLQMLEVAIDENIISVDISALDD